MAITLRAKKVVVFAGTNSSGTITLTSGWNTSFGDGNANYAPVQDDVVVVAYAVGATSDTNPAITTGYTEEANLYANATADSNLTVSVKRMGATPDTDFTRSSTGGTANAGAIMVEVWSGVDTSDYSDVATTTATGTATGRPDPPSITPSSAGAKVLVYGAAAASTGAAFTQSGSELSNFLSNTSPDNVDAMIGSGDFSWTSGAFDPVAWTGGTTGASDSWCAACVALKPAPTLPAHSHGYIF